jgi:hypothetical protein
MYNVRKSNFSKYKIQVIIEGDYDLVVQKTDCLS